MPMLRDPRDAELRQELLRVLIGVAGGGPITPQQRYEVLVAVSDVLEAEFRTHPARTPNTVVRTLLKRLLLGLYGLGAAGIGVTLSAMFTGSLQLITLAAAFAASLVCYLAASSSSFLRTHWSTECLRHRNNGRQSQLSGNRRSPPDPRRPGSGR